MKRLISEEEVLKNKDKKEIFVDKNTIITALAKDICKKLGIEIKYGECLKEVKKDNECVIEDKKEVALSENQIFKILKEGIDQGLLSEKDIERMLG